MSYKFYNANPKGLFIDDCVLRSISVAEGISWGECQEKLSRLANKEGRLLNEVIFVEDYLDKRYPRKCIKDMTVGEFASMCPKGRSRLCTNQKMHTPSSLASAANRRFRRMSLSSTKSA